MPRAIMYLYGIKLISSRIKNCKGRTNMTIAEEAGV
jgi:hypothetical protein